MSHPWLRRPLLATILVASTLSGFVHGGTVASFTGTRANGGDQFTAGTVLLGAGVATGDSLSATNLVPGDSFTARLTVQNSGTLTLRYAMATSTSGSAALAGALQVTVRTKTTNPCASLDGAALYGPGSLNAAAFGSPATGAQPGDRTLGPNASEDICFTVTLPAGASATLQETNSTATVTFTAEQVAGT
jgi:hypothetical protein